MKNPNEFCGIVFPVKWDKNNAFLVDAKAMNEKFFEENKCESNQ